MIAQIQTALEGKAVGVTASFQDNKTVTPTTSVQTVVADSGYDGLKKVTVNAIPSDYVVPSGSINITTNGTHDIKNYASAVVNIATSGDSGGSSSGGGSGEINTGTCTIKTTVPSSSNYYFAYEKVTSGALAYQIDRNYSSGTLSKTARCDSVMYIQGSTVKGATLDDGELLKIVSGYGIVYRTPSTSGITATVTLTA